MVYFEDLNTPFDISMEDLASWDDSPEHEAAHAHVVRNFVVVENAPPVIVVTYERKFQGKWGNSKTRITSFPPFVRFIEELEGEFAGSRFAGIHRPDGARMRIDMFGDIQSKTLSGEKLKAHWMEVLGLTYDEDVKSLQKFRERTKSVSK